MQSIKSLPVNIPSNFSECCAVVLPPAHVVPTATGSKRVEILGWPCMLDAMLHACTALRKQCSLSLFSGEKQGFLCL